jgi:hypothetical protein
MSTPSRPSWANILHPFRRPGGGPIPILAAIVLIAFAASFVIGVAVGRHASGNYFQGRYHHSLQVFRVPPPRTTPNLPRIVAVSPAATINLSLFPHTGDQGPVGSCAAWVAAWISSFEYRLTHHHSMLRWSAKWMYEHFGNGADDGSYVSDDVAPFSTVGVPRFKQYPFPPWALSPPDPNKLDAYGKHTLGADAARYIQPVQVLYGGTGAALVEFIREQIYSGHPVGIAIPVYQSFESSTGYVDVPDLSREYVLGGHEINGIAYDDTIHFPSGNVGGALIQNQWGERWGGDIMGDGGRAWVSYAFLARFAYEATSVRLGSAAGAPAAPISAQFTPHATFPPPPLPTVPRSRHGRGGGWWMRSGPYHKLINAAASKRGIWPLGLAALVGTESNFITDRSSIRCPNYYDCSAGLTQVAVPTARSYGVTGTTDQILNWELVPNNDLSLTARILPEARRLSCERFAPLYAAYNQGWYLGCHAWQYTSPPAGYAIQAYTNYKGWLRYATSIYAFPARSSSSNGGRTYSASFLRDVTGDHSRTLLEYDPPPPFPPFLPKSFLPRAARRHA